MRQLLEKLLSEDGLVPYTGKSVDKKVTKDAELLGKHYTSNKTDLNKVIRALSLGGISQDQAEELIRQSEVPEVQSQMKAAILQVLMQRYALTATQAKEFIDEYGYDAHPTYDMIKAIKNLSRGILPAPKAKRIEKSKGVTDSFIAGLYDDLRERAGNMFEGIFEPASKGEIAFRKSRGQIMRFVQAANYSFACFANGYVRSMTGNSTQWGVVKKFEAAGNLEQYGQILQFIVDTATKRINKVKKDLENFRRSGTPPTDSNESVNEVKGYEPFKDLQSAVDYLKKNKGIKSLRPVVGHTDLYYVNGEFSYNSGHRTAKQIINQANQEHFYDNRDKMKSKEKELLSNKPYTYADIQTLQPYKDMLQLGFKDSSTDLQKQRCNVVFTYDANQLLKPCDLKNESVEERIVEGLADVKKMYVDSKKIPEDLFNKLSEFDPTPQKKYIQWICKRFLSERMDPQDVRMFEVVKDFDDLVNKKIITGQESDIYTYKTLEALVDKTLQLKDVKTKGEEVKDIKTKGARLVFQNDKANVYHITSKEASCFYGSGTRWCTAASSSSNYFNNYHWDQAVNLYYIIVKDPTVKDDLKKVAVAVYPSGKKVAYDSQDRQINPYTLSNYCTNLGIPLK